MKVGLTSASGPLTASLANGRRGCYLGVKLPRPLRDSTPTTTAPDKSQHVATGRDLLRTLLQINLSPRFPLIAPQTGISRGYRFLQRV
jgi:hypothetical protein